MIGECIWEAFAFKKNRYDPCPFSYSIVDPNDLPQRPQMFAPNEGRPQKTLITQK